MISLAIGHTVEWRLHRQWQYIDDQLDKAAADRTLWQKILGIKSLRQLCLQKLQNNLELVHPAVLQKKTKVVAQLQVIENSDYSGSTERNSFDSTASYTEKAAHETMKAAATRSHQALHQDHHAMGFNHYFRDAHRKSFFHSPDKVYCETPAEETVTTSVRHKKT
jgi:hypothetical protein